jgi:hypothetical protein
MKKFEPKIEVLEHATCPAGSSGGGGCLYNRPGILPY